MSKSVLNELPDRELPISVHDTGTCQIGEQSRRRSIRCTAVGFTSLEIGTPILRKPLLHQLRMYEAFEKR
jgi:hypothetical protein